MSKNQTMSLFDNGSDETVCALSPPTPAHQVFNQDNAGCSKISTKIVTEVAPSVERKTKIKQNESIVPHTETSGRSELLQTAEESEKEVEERGLAHWRTAAETLSQIAFRLASTSNVT